VICPSTEELAAIYDGNLDRKQADAVRDHVASCPRCAHELRVLHRSLQAVPKAPSPPADLVAKAIKARKKGSIAPQINLIHPNSHPVK
jgi:anti-sigma factor RsiW